MIRIISEDQSSTKYFRYEAHKYSPGDQIVIDRTSRNYDQIIIDEYKNATGLDVTKVVYFHDHLDNYHYLDGHEIYKYLYEVSPEGKIFKGVMDYSAYLCASEKEHIIKKRGQVGWKLFVKYMSQAYSGSSEAQLSLNEVFDYGLISSDNFEYISENVKVVKLIESREGDT